MELTFIGCGGAFAGPDQYQTNAVIKCDDKYMMIDCGSDARHALNDQIINLSEIDAVYISHLHADHIGGIEWLAFCTYFNPSLGRLTLYCNADVMNSLWFNSLRGGLDSIEGKVMDLTDYFECRPIADNCQFKWRDIAFKPVQTVHVMAGRKIVHSYGLLIESPPRPGCNRNWVTFYTADTQFCPNQIRAFYERADIIFQDCETTPYKSGVHAHIDDLKTLPPEIKEKMWLMHYAPFDKLTMDDMQKVARDAGFVGFVVKGQTFEL